MRYALVGNQNCGKTTLFNQLTGSNQHVGNFPGVTVDSKEGIIKDTKDSVIDLPGIYSLSPYSTEEIVTRDYIIQQKPDAIINIIDATNIERNLYLSLQLMELHVPMIIAANMMDEVIESKTSIDIKLLSKELGVPVIPISAIKNEGIDDLLEAIQQVALQKKYPTKYDFCTGAIHRAIHGITHLIEDHAQALGVPARFAAIKLIEGDVPMQQALRLTANEIDMIEHSVVEMEEHLQTDREAATADMRYNYIEQVCAKTVHKTGESKAYLRSVKIDSLLTHKYFAIPIFLGIMLSIFYLTFNVIGAFLSDLLALGVDSVTAFVDGLLTTYQINPVVHSLVIDGVFAGVGSVLSFLPIIIVLFFFLSILEDSGYMARIAFVMDKLLRKIGLSGRSIVPMLIGFGCTVPAVMASRTLSSERDRKMTIFLTPFMSCSAKLPIYTVFAYAFFEKYQAWVMISLYVLGILVGILFGLVFKTTAFKGKPVPFVLELPNYRMPSAKSVVLLMWDKAKDFLTRAFTIIFIGSIIIWFLQSFDFRFNTVESSQSMLAYIGKSIAPLFAPMGFNDWRVATSLISGFTAKEAVVSTLAVLTSTSTSGLTTTLPTIFSPLSAYSFLIFTLLYTPCVAAISAIKQELESGWLTICLVILQCSIAWLCAVIFYQVGILLF